LFGLSLGDLETYIAVAWQRTTHHYRCK